MRVWRVAKNNAARSAYEMRPARRFATGDVFFLYQSITSLICAANLEYNFATRLQATGISRWRSTLSIETW
jgi:hypothetical protein